MGGDVTYDGSGSVMLVGLKLLALAFYMNCHIIMHQH